MRYPVSTPLLLVVAAAGLAIFLPQPFNPAHRLAALSRDTYEVMVQGEAPFEVSADRLVMHPSGMVTLESEDVTVAAFMGYQVVYAVRTDAKSSREYELKTHDEVVKRLRADRLVFDQGGLIRLEASGELVGVVSQNVRYLVATDARP